MIFLLLLLMGCGKVELTENMDKCAPTIKALDRCNAALEHTEIINELTADTPEDIVQ